MDCKEMILSEDTYDIITDFSASEFLGDDNNCYERIGEDFLILYLGNLGIRNPKIDFFPYHNMPKLYGLMQLSPSGETPPGAAPFDPASLIASGITQVQRPPLNLTGRGVILCFIDTGIDYRNPVFLDENGNDIMEQQIQANYRQIKQDIVELVENELIRIENDPELKHLLGGDEGVQTTS